MENSGEFDEQSSRRQILDEVCAGRKSTHNVGRFNSGGGMFVKYRLDTVPVAAQATRYLGLIWIMLRFDTWNVSTQHRDGCGHQ